MRLLVIAEAEADRRMVCGLVDRKIVRHAPDWFDREKATEELIALRTWCGLEPGTLFTRWHSLRQLTAEAKLGGFRGVAALGRPRSEVRGYDYETVRKALILCVRLVPAPDAVVIVRDLDRGDADVRCDSIRRARADAPTSPAVFLALPRPKREAWLLNGFSPGSPAEEKVLNELHAELGFHPCREAHSLTAEAPGSKRDIKRVFDQINAQDATRVERCWEEAAWGILRAHGVETGLAQFLEEVKTYLVPVVTGQPAEEES